MREAEKPAGGPTEAVFVLVRPRFSGNLGAAARVLQNFGQRHLRLVDPEASLDEEARRMAVDARGLLESAAHYPTLEDAVADLQWTVATASLRGRDHAEHIPIRGAVREAAGRAGANRIGFVFGPEQSGLTTHEVSLCRVLSRIPSLQSHPTLNLAQAVGIVAYELFLAQQVTTHRRALAPTASLEELFSHLREALLQIGFLDRHNPEHMLRAVRRLVSRARPDAREVAILRGVCRQILWAAGRRGTPPGGDTREGG